jgi:hypothetical protein
MWRCDKQTVPVDLSISSMAFLKLLDAKSQLRG